MQRAMFAQESRPNFGKGPPDRPSAPIVALVLALCVLSASGSMASPSSQETGQASAIARADLLYEARGNIDNVRRAISILRAEADKNPRNFKAWWRIAKFDCYLARHVPDKSQQSILEDGIAAGKKAENLEPGRPEGHFWVGANQGLLAEARGLWGGLRLITPIENEMHEVMKLDPGYMDYGAERVLGRLYFEAPFFKGGNKQLSVRLLEDCLRRYPDDSLTMMYLADSYRSTGRPGEARKMLEKILSLHSDPLNGPELAEYKEQARRQLQKYYHVAMR